MILSPEAIIWLFLFGVFIVVLFVLKKTFPKKFKFVDDDKRTLFAKIMNLLLVINLVIGGLIISISLVAGVPTNDPNGDITNWVTLIVEVGIGIAIGFTIYLYSDFQQKQNSTLVKRMATVLNERQLSVIFRIQSQNQSLTDKIEHMKKLIGLWQTEQDISKKETRFNTLIHQINTLKNYLDNNVVSEISQVTNREITNNYQRLLGKCALDSSYFDMPDDLSIGIPTHLNEIGDIVKDLTKSLDEFMRNNNLTP